MINEHYAEYLESIIEKYKCSVLHAPLVRSLRDELKSLNKIRSKKNERTKAS